jgi:hypothetical protein
VNLDTYLLFSAAQPPPEFWIAFFILFPILWCLICADAAWFGGWREMSKYYRAEATTFRIHGRDSGKRFWFGSIATGSSNFPVNYGSCVTIHVSAEGIGLKVLLPFRMLHPPLLIPWSAIENCQADKVFLFIERATIHLRHIRFPLRIFGAAGKEVFNSWTQQLAQPRRRDVV